MNPLRFLILFSAILAILLSSCGNIKNQESNNTNNSGISSITFYDPLSSNIIFGSCENLTLHQGDNTTTAQELQNTSVCTSTSPLGFVKFFTPNLMEATSVCIIPILSNNTLAIGNCANSATNGTIVNVDVSEFSSLILIKESDKNLNYPTFAQTN